MVTGLIDHKQEVFDAAMAWNAAFNGCDKYDFDAAVNRLRDACRKAEEAAPSAWDNVSANYEPLPRQQGCTTMDGLTSRLANDTKAEP